MSLRGITQETELSSAALCHRLAERDGIYVDVLHRCADVELVGRISRLFAMDSGLDAIHGFLDELIAISPVDPHDRGYFLVNRALNGATMS